MSNNENNDYEKVKYGYVEPPGKRRDEVPGKEKYICPNENCNYEWFRNFVGEEIPLCPVHKRKCIKANVE